MILKIFILALFLLNVHCQSPTRGDDRHNKYPAGPPQYIISNPRFASGLVEPQEGLIEQNIPGSRSQRIPAPLYQFSPSEIVTQNAYYQTQPQQDNFQYQPQQQAVSPKNYEQIIKNSQQTRLRNVERKVPLVEQYLKEVTPTTKTVYQRPANYLGFVNQPNIGAKQEQIDDVSSQLKPQAAGFQFNLQPDLQQERPFPNYQFDTQEQIKPAVPQQKSNFNAVSPYRNVPIEQQRFLSEPQEDSTPKSSIYVAQNVPKKSPRTKLPKKRPIIQQNIDQQAPIDFQAQFEKLQQLQSHVFSIPQQQEQPAPVKYQQPIPSRNPYQSEESPIFQQIEKEQEQIQEVPQYRQPKQRVLPKPRPSTYRTEESPNDNQNYEYQVTPPTYQQVNKRPTKYYDPKLRYQTVSEAPQSEIKYQPQQTNFDESLLQPQQIVRQPGLRLRQYQDDSATRQQIRYKSERQQSDESQQIVEYRPSDLNYQPEPSGRYHTIGGGAPISFRPSQIQSTNSQLYRSFGRPTSYTVFE